MSTGVPTCEGIEVMRDPGQPKVCNSHIVVLVYQEIPCTGEQPSLPSLYASFIAVQSVKNLREHSCMAFEAFPRPVYRLEEELSNLPDLRSLCSTLCACRCCMPRAAPQHMFATWAHVSSSVGECSIPYSEPLQAPNINTHSFCRVLIRMS